MDIQNTKGPDPLLYKQPTELGLTIVGNFIASGHPEFMRALRALQEDGQAIICKKKVSTGCASELETMKVASAPVTRLLG